MQRKAAFLWQDSCEAADMESLPASFRSESPLQPYQCREVQFSSSGESILNCQIQFSHPSEAGEQTHIKQVPQLEHSGQCADMT